MTGHFTILSGPPMTGKTTYSNMLAEDESVKPFIKFEGHGERKVIDQVFRALEEGRDVVYETTSPIVNVPLVLLERVDTIEIFRKKY
jgi:replication-associated recombination protein RarA